MRITKQGLTWSYWEPNFTSVVIGKDPKVLRLQCSLYFNIRRHIFSSSRICKNCLMFVIWVELVQHKIFFLIKLIRLSSMPVLRHTTPIDQVFLEPCNGRKYDFERPTQEKRCSESQNPADPVAINNFSRCLLDKHCQSIIEEKTKKTVRWNRSWANFSLPSLDQRSLDVFQPMALHGLLCVRSHCSPLLTDSPPGLHDLFYKRFTSTKNALIFNGV